MLLIKNIPDAFFCSKEEITAAPLEFDVSGDFWGVVARSGAVLAVSREYENFDVLLGGAAGEPWQAQLPILHPSGMFWNSTTQELIVASTRQLN